MKIYVVIIGEYEDQHVGFVSNDLDNIVDYIYTHFNCNDTYKEFNIMECWEDDKQLFVYGDNYHDIVYCKSKFDKEELKLDLIKHSETIIE